MKKADYFENTTMQLTVDLERQAFDIHVTRRSADKDAPPRIRRHRDISLASVARFYALSGGYRVAYSHKEKCHADQR